MVACLNDEYEEAVDACNILRHFCSSEVDPCGDHALLLARLQGVRRLSTILNAVHGGNVHMEATGMAIGHTQNPKFCEWNVSRGGVTAFPCLRACKLSEST